jgi:hypothetical protein
VIAMREFTVRPATACASDQPHTWRHHGDGADLIAYGVTDLGVTVQLGRCRYCGIALLAVGPYGGDFAELPVWLELPDAGLGEA